MIARFAGRHAFVSGAGGGIGAATVARLSEEGALVWASDLAMMEASVPTGTNIRFLALDVSSEVGWEESARILAEEAGHLDVVANVAGQSTGDVVSDPASVDYAAWQRCQQVNADGIFLSCRALWPLLKGSKAGAMVNVASLAAMVGTPFDPAYGAAKAAVWQLTKTYAKAGAALNPPVRANSVHPGIIWTPMWERHAERLANAQGIATDEVVASAMSAVPMRRAGTAREVASIIAFLASDDASYITGQQIIADGGMTA